MSGMSKGMLIMLMILYMVSPIDLCPGPIDDFIVMLFCIGAQMGIGGPSDNNGD